MKKKMIIGASITGAILIVVILLIMIFNGDLFVSKKQTKDYYDCGDYTSSEIATNDIVSVKLDMTNNTSEKIVFYEKNNMKLSLEKIHYNAESDNIEFIVVSSGKISDSSIAYISLSDFKKQLCTYYMGLIYFDLTDIEYLNKEGNAAYLFTLTHDDNITTNDFKNLSTTLYFENSKIVTYTEN